MKILQVVSSLQLGGAEHVGAFLAARFSQEQGLGLVSLGPGALGRELTARSIGYAVPPSGLWRRCWRRLARLRRPVQAAGAVRWDIGAAGEHARWFERQVAGEKFDVIHLHTLLCAGLAPVARRYAKRVVFGHHNMLSARHSAEEIAFLTGMLRHCDGVVCVSESSRRDLVDQCAAAAEVTGVIHNGSLWAGGFRLRSGPVRTIGTLSNLGIAKGVDTLLRAWARVCGQGVDAVLKIGGGSPGVVQKWKQYARQVQAGRVVFTGELTSVDAIEAFYDELDLFVLPSRSEGHPLVIPEAFSRGLPVLCSALETLQECVRDARLLFRPEDEADLADHLLALSGGGSSELAELSREARTVYETRFSEAAVAGHYAAFYSGLLFAS